MSLARTGRLLLRIVACATLLVNVYVTSTPLERIVGGQSAKQVNIPYIVSLVNFGYHSCGGSIINERTVLTAAHCLAITTARLLKVHAGAKTRALDEGVLVPVSAIHYHQQWTMDTMDHDIGVVRLMQPLTYSSTIQPIQLPQRSDVVQDGSYASVAGWGYMSMIGPQAEMLRYARVPIVAQETCNRLMGGAITPRMICAGYVRGGVDACQMDSGGPLVVQEKLIGIVSWGVGCALPEKPGVYTRVTELRPWVEQLLARQYNEII